MYTIKCVPYKQPVPYLPVNASMDNTVQYFKSGVFPTFTKSTSFELRYKTSVPYLPVTAGTDIMSKVTFT